VNRGRGNKMEDTGYDVLHLSLCQKVSGEGECQSRKKNGISTVGGEE